MYSCVSSACRLCAEIRLPTGDVYMANNSGPRTLPCGTPDVELAGADCSAPTATYCSRSVTKDCSQLRTVSQMPKS